jgi:ADP-ribosylglycohydrolase
MVRELPRRLQEHPEPAFRVIAGAGMATPEFAEPIITPFVIPTVLAALWCLLRHPDSWRKGVASAIRLGGDVDTLGAIVGALLGARLGLASIPHHLVEAVLDRDVLQTLALRYHALVTRKR